MTPIISFVGKHNSGKTTLLTNVVRVLTGQGVKIAVIKHASHNVSIQPAGDSERLFLAGADTVYVASPEISIKYEHRHQLSLADIYKQVSPGMDLVITEGYKEEFAVKIEVMRREISTQPLGVENVIARVIDFPFNDDLPQFNFDQAEQIARFIMEYIQRG